MNRYRLLTSNSDAITIFLRWCLDSPESILLAIGSRFFQTTLHGYFPENHLTSQQVLWRTIFDSFRVDIPS